MPLVSVVMSVFNAEEFVGKAIESILNQTFNDFEFIIVNDGSVDGTPDILEKYGKNDKRIKIITHENKGLTKCLNIGINNSSGKYIARQDADDFSYPERIENQVNAFKKDSSLILLGTRAIINIKGFMYESPLYTDTEITNKITKYNIFVHSSVMFRRSEFMKIGMYNELYKTAQDYEAWMRLSGYGKLSILDRVLVERTVRKNSISNKKMLFQCYNGYKIRRPYIPLILNIIFAFYQFTSDFAPLWLIKIVKRKGS